MWYTLFCILTLKKYIICNWREGTSHLLKIGVCYLSHCGKVWIDDVKLSIISFYSTKGAAGTGTNFPITEKLSTPAPTKDAASTGPSRLRHNFKTCFQQLMNKRKKLKEKCSFSYGEVSINWGDGACALFQIGFRLANLLAGGIELHCVSLDIGS